MKTLLRIGTRGSRLAMTQTKMVKKALLEHHPELDIEVVEIKTSGDWHPKQGETRLSESEGGKGLFAREIEQALLEERIDCAVHSMKDMASFPTQGLTINHMLTREDPRDAFISDISRLIEELPKAAIVGTASTRRQAFLLAIRPDLKIAPLRGNVPTRLEKLHNGQVEATLLAVAGLKRLGMEKEISSIIPVEKMLPAAGQGAIGIQTRDTDKNTQKFLEPISCSETVVCVAAERAALQVLDGSCHTPIGAYAVLAGEEISLRVAVASLDGRQFFEETGSQQVSGLEDAIKLGSALGSAIKAHLPEGFLT